MKVPPGYTEEEVLAVLQRIADSVAYEFAFGSFTPDDIRQQAIVEGLEGLPRFDPDRPLENFLRVHIRNRLLNLIRKESRRSDPPCKTCHRGHSCQFATKGGTCEKYAAWNDRNNKKAILARGAGDAGCAEPPVQDAVEDTAAFDEMTTRINNELPPALRADYLRMLAGQNIPKARRLKVEEAVALILREGYAR